ncbi:class I SAM-dependent methyltransferase [Candidatus Woesearchaeota archaeon]|nr:class I SAM-dependent methyltransferase [Candidatus Woesearchaeota archaeon]
MTMKKNSRKSDFSIDVQLPFAPTMMLDSGKVLIEKPAEIVHPVASSDIVWSQDLNPDCIKKPADYVRAKLGLTPAQPPSKDLQFLENKGLRPPRPGPKPLQPALSGPEGNQPEIEVTLADVEEMEYLNPVMEAFSSETPASQTRFVLGKVPLNPVMEAFSSETPLLDLRGILRKQRLDHKLRESDIKALLQGADLVACLEHRLQEDDLEEVRQHFQKAPPPIPVDALVKKNGNSTLLYKKKTPEPSASTMNEKINLIQAGKSLSKKAIRGISTTNLDKFTEFRVKDIEQIIAELVSDGSLNLTNLGGKVVDFGTGSGAGAYVLKQYGAKVTGVEILEGPIEAARKIGIDVVEANGLKYLEAIKKESLNCITAFMLDDFDYAHLLKQAKRTLKPAGQLLITVPPSYGEELKRQVKEGRVGAITTKYYDPNTDLEADYKCNYFLYTHTVL